MLQLSHEATRGRKHEIKVFKEDDGTFSIREYTSGRETGACIGYTCIQQLYIVLCRKVYNAKLYDGIRYETVGNGSDLLSFEMVQAAK